MSVFSPFSSLSNNIENRNNTKLTELVDKIKKSNDGCSEDEDCDKLISTCCKSIVSLVFGVIPLTFECTNCGKKLNIKDILD